MRILGGAVTLLLVGTTAVFAQESSAQEDLKDQIILELQKKIEALEARVQDLETKPAPAAGETLETRLDEAIHKSPVDPLGEPTRLNFSAPGLESVTWSGFFRWRASWFGNYNSPFTGNEDDNLSFDQRLDLGIGMRLSEQTQFYAEIHDARVWGTELPMSTVQDNDEFSAVHLDIADVYGSNVDLRLGRQKVELGAERMVGEDEWLNTPTRFDGLSATTGFGNDTELFVGAFRLFDGDTVFVNEFSPGGAAPGFDTANAEFYVAYVSNQNDTYGEVDVYIMLVDADEHSITSFNPGVFVPGVGIVPQETRLTNYGARWAHGIEPFWWEVEAATQFGDINGSRTHDYGFDNWALYSRFGWAAEGVDYLSGLYAGYDYATGGSNGYVTLFPSTHGWFGVMDFVGWSNVLHFVLGAGFDVADGELDVSWHWFNLENDTAGNFGLNSFSGGTGEGDIGQEFDITYSVACTDNSAVDLGLGYFLPGNAYTDIFGGHSDTVFAYAVYGITF